MSHEPPTGTSRAEPADGDESAPGAPLSTRLRRWVERYRRRRAEERAQRLQREGEQRIQDWADQAWPLRFPWHSFGARSWNVRRCSILYDNHEHGPKDITKWETVLRPAGPPPRPDWKDDWSGSYLVSPSDHGGKLFPDEPVRIAWTSLDGSEHAATVDLDAIFVDRRVLHNVKREDIPVGWLAAWWKDPLPVDILLEVNDRTVSVYMSAFIATIQEQVPGKPNTRSRVDPVLAWTHTY